MAELTYSSRCINDPFGYCAKGLKGISVSTTPQGVVSYVGTEVRCNENWAECEDHMKFTDIVKDDEKINTTKEVKSKVKTK